LQDKENRPGRGVLIVGYGNQLRADDGLGWRAVELLEQDARVAGATLLSRHQLTPELALDFSGASLVILIDAAADVAPGAVAVRRVEPAASGSLMSHHVDPAGLAAMARRLYAASPRVYMVSLGAASLDDGEALTPIVEAALPNLVDAVAQIVARDGGAMAGA
jgi:hydrogenase maturation protease